MTKDELKNRISMALQDPILQQGFEIICKNLTEQEEKIADIKANCDYILEGKEIEYREERNKLCADFENMKAGLESKIADLEWQLQEVVKDNDNYQAENKKLEQQIEKMKCCGNCKSFKGYGETCEGWGEPVLNLNCDCTEWELRR